ncbi:hypothetical protein ANCDUO_18098 [Ancylostoma duodenale]|uniref:Uncharacterized protein n=1 Tax=Ancylostoma duodenale TaxID=51022 RepID=A0A0C2FYQ7_9BILA|nr:hypothetical protein ANCDUO_18098 [Ancylostoma duodenale]
MPFRSAQVRQERRGLLLLRKEIFYQAVQSGIKPAEAQKLAENAVTEAQQRLTAQRKARIEGVKEEEDTARAQKAERAESEQKFYDYAMQMAEKMLYQDDMLTFGSKARKTIKPDPSVPSLLKGSKRLGIWENLENCHDEEEDTARAQKAERAESEQKFYDYAMQMAEKMLYQDDMLTFGSKARKTIKPDSSVPSLLKGSKRLGIWENLENCHDVGLQFWKEWDLRSARLTVEKQREIVNSTSLDRRE